MKKERKLKKIQELKKNHKNCSFETLNNILLSFEFECIQPSKGSSHFKYRKPGYIIIVPYNKPVKEIYIKKVILILEEILNNDE
jgi:hypothetical protein